MRLLGLMLLVVAAAFLVVTAPGRAQNAATSSFDHAATGFALTGTHISVSCAACHVNGRMKNTPTQCIGCHNTMTAPGLPQSHPKTTFRCDGCHLTTTWRDISFMDHAQATGPCASCHNNKLAIGKSSSHILTNAPCGNCHHNTVSFAGATATGSAAGTTAAPATKTVVTTPTTKPTSPTPPAATPPAGTPPASMPPATALVSPMQQRNAAHSGVTNPCSMCHNGVTADGKPPTHILTNAPCESCHKSTVTFEGARVDHASLTAICSSCHNGTTAEGKPARHFITAVPCDTCHRTTAWIPANYRHISPAYVNHGVGLDCSGCHAANAQVVAWKFPAFRPGCAGCHVDKFRPTSHVKLAGPVKVYYTVAELRDCTGACHIYKDITQRTILTRQSGVHRLAGGGW